MVGQGHRGRGSGFSDALKGDTTVEAAAFAVLVGADPIAYLSASGADFYIQHAIYQRALDIDTERRSTELKVIIEAFSALMKLISKKSVL